MDREMLTMIATIVAVLGVVFLFREMNKAKKDVESLKNFSAQLVHSLSEPPVQEQEQEQETEVAEEKNEE